MIWKVIQWQTQYYNILKTHLLINHLLIQESKCWLREAKMRLQQNKSTIDAP